MIQLITLVELDSKKAGQTALLLLIKFDLHRPTDNIGDLIELKRKKKGAAPLH
jgi:hypothetical protein